MSRFLDYGENQVADILRGVPWALDTSIWLGLASAVSDAGLTELAGTGYARQAMLRDLATWAGTQGIGTTTISNGTTAASSNNALINFGTAGSAWGTAAFITFHTAATGGNCFAALPLPVPFAISLSDVVSFAAGSITFTLGLSGGVSAYLANKLIDLIWRGVAYTYPATTYIALCTTAPTNTSGGTEVPSSGSYARRPLTSSLAAICGTQAAGSTGLSTGTSGQISNNSPITFASPTGSWGTITHDKQMDAASGGNMLFYSSLDTPKTVLSGGTPPSYAGGSYKILVA